MLQKYVVFTSHSRERLEQFNISPAKANWLLYSAVEEKILKEMRGGKNKYNESAKYLRNGSIIFTLIDGIDRSTSEDCYLLVSVYDQLIDLTERQLQKK